MTNAHIAIIGGSGLYDMEELENLRELHLDTPFGAPSDAIVIGKLAGVDIAFLPRHGRGHRINPTNLPVRANIYALKSLGVQRIVSVSAVGSLRKELKPLDMVIPDQIIDRTRHRAGTFFDEGVVAHVAFADPFCPHLSDLVYRCVLANGANIHKGGTYIVMEGPAFSTRAESALYRLWGADVIGMTAMPEAKLAREAEMCYTTLACVTDYDCWHVSEEDVTVEMVIGNLMKNVARSKDILRRLILTIPEERQCACSSALKDAIITDRNQIPVEVRDKLHPMLAKYLD
jgi:5'-methylthioadenosine phosphorylase